MRRALAVIAVIAAFPVQAAPIAVSGVIGQELTVELLWQAPVDLDLFLTDPNGETVYFANRTAKSGARMGVETGCKQVMQEKGNYRESAVIPKALSGRYRVSVDFIKDCGSKAVSAAFEAVLRSKEGRELGRGRSEVQYRLLNPVGWEFEVK